MKAWLSREHKYCKVVIEPALQRQLEGDNPHRLDIMNIIKRQVTDGLHSRTIVSCKWELNGDNIEIGFAV